MLAYMITRHQRALYPETSAYRSETGGLLKMLRILTAQQSEYTRGQCSCRTPYHSAW